MEYSSIAELSLDGGCVVFDFTNTIGSRKEERIRDYMKSYTDFLEWLKRQEIVPQKKLKELSALALKEPAKCNRALKKILETREVLYALFSFLSQGQKPEKEVLEKFNKMLRESFSHIRLEIGTSKNEINFSDADLSYLEPLHLILKSAYDILTQEDMSRIKECPSC